MSADRPSAVTLRAGEAICLVRPADGGRISRLVVGGRDLLVTADDEADPKSWGCYPMVPWAGRVRDGRFEHGGRRHQLPLNLGRHAIHGTVFDRPWTLDTATGTTTATSTDVALVRLGVELGDRWPLGGRVDQVVELSPTSLVSTLTVTAGDRSMPAQVGWHPWFVKPVFARLRFAAMYARDAAGIPTGSRTVQGAGPWDDCFVGPLEPLTLAYQDLTLTISSDCDHWVVYDEPAHATCVEPQSGPPDGFTLAPDVLAPNRTLTRFMRLTWQVAPQVPGGRAAR